MCGSMVDIQSATAQIRRGIKKKKIERNYRMKILRSALLHRATIIIRPTSVSESTLILYSHTKTMCTIIQRLFGQNELITGFDECTRINY